MSTNDHGTELWVTDGTETGTHEFNILLFGLTLNGVPQY